MFTCASVRIFALHYYCYFLFKSLFAAGVLYKVTPVRARGKSVEEKQSNHSKPELAEAAENSDV